MGHAIHTSPIGCALRDTSLQLAQLQWPSGGAPRLLTASESYGAGRAADVQSPSQSIPQALQRALAAAPFIGRDVVSCLAASHMIYRCMRLAPMPDAEMDAAVQWQIATDLAWRITDFRSGFYDMGEVVDAGRHRREIVAAAALATDLDAHVRVLQEGGCVPQAIDTAPGAVARCLLGVDEPWFVVDIGASSSIVMVVREGQPRLIRAVPMGWQTPDRDAPDSGEPNQSRVAREIAYELTLCLHYLNDTQPLEPEPRTGCVIGCGSQEDLVIKVLTEASAVEFKSVRDIPPRRILPCMDQAPAPHDQWLLPIGLALHGCETRAQGATA